MAKALSWCKLAPSSGWQCKSTHRPCIRKCQSWPCFALTRLRNTAPNLCSHICISFQLPCACCVLSVCRKQAQPSALCPPASPASQGPCGLSPAQPIRHCCICRLADNVCAPAQRWAGRDGTDPGFTHRGERRNKSCRHDAFLPLFAANSPSPCRGEQPTTDTKLIPNVHCLPANSPWVTCVADICQKKKSRVFSRSTCSPRWIWTALPCSSQCGWADLQL